jgi:hypothetical protein
MYLDNYIEGALLSRGAERTSGLSVRPLRNAVKGGSFMGNERPIVTKANEERVRSGETGHHVRYILLASLALVIVLFLLIAAFFH